MPQSGRYSVETKGLMRQTNTFCGTCETPAPDVLQRKHWADRRLNQCFRRTFFGRYFGTQDRPWGLFAFCIRN